MLRYVAAFSRVNEGVLLNYDKGLDRLKKNLSTYPLRLLQAEVPGQTAKGRPFSKASKQPLEKS